MAQSRPIRSDAAPRTEAAGRPMPAGRALPPGRPGTGPGTSVATAAAVAPPRPPTSPLETRAPHARPDPNPLRLLYAFAGIASASAIATMLLPTVLPSAATGAGTVDAAVQAPAPVQHVTRYVTLQPGQTAPPNAPVVVQPTPTPRVHIVTRTRQSGLP
jgi:hypothetical protein